LKPLQEQGPVQRGYKMEVINWYVRFRFLYVSKFLLSPVDAQIAPETVRKPSNVTQNIEGEPCTLEEIASANNEVSSCPQTETTGVLEWILGMYPAKSVVCANAFRRHCSSS
jgi:hypothetical protein